MIAPAERVEEERERDEPAHELRERIVRRVVRVARLLKGPEGSDGTKHPERDELRFRNGVEALHMSLSLSGDYKNVQKADDGTGETGPEGIDLKTSVNLLMGSVLLCSVACHIGNRISRLVQGFDDQVDERDEHAHKARQERILPEPLAPCIRLMPVERFRDETLLAVVESHTRMLSRS